MKLISAGCAVAALALVFSPAAVAGHGKVGLWLTKVTAAGQTMSVKACMTAADLAGDVPISKQTPNCKMQNPKVVGNTYSIDVVCTGEMPMKSHISATWISPEHYTSVQTMDMSMQGQTMHSVTNVDATWIGPNCGNVK